MDNNKILEQLQDELEANWEAFEITTEEGDVMSHYWLGRARGLQRAITFLEGKE